MENKKSFLEISWSLCLVLFLVVGIIGFVNTPVKGTAAAGTSLVGWECPDGYQWHSNGTSCFKEVSLSITGYSGGTCTCTETVSSPDVSGQCQCENSNGIPYTADCIDANGCGCTKTISKTCTSKTSSTNYSNSCTCSSNGYPSCGSAKYGGSVKNTVNNCKSNPIYGCPTGERVGDKCIVYADAIEVDGSNDESDSECPSGQYMTEDGCVASIVSSCYDGTGYCCWFCSGVEKWQGGQNGCQYPVSLTDRDGNGEINNYDCGYVSSSSSSSSKVVSVSFEGSTTQTCTLDDSTGQCTVTAPSAPSKTGYTFEGWGYSSGFLQPGTLVKVSKDTSYAAFWKEVGPCYQCNSNGNLYSWGVTGSSTACPGGWHVISGVDAANCKSTSSSSSSNIINVNASFNANGGSGGGTKSCSYDKSSGDDNCTVTAPSASRSGYTFKGWGTSSTCTSGSVSAGSIVTLTQNKTYYACWGANSGGTSSPSSTSASPSSSQKPSSGSSGGSYTPTHSSSSSSSSYVDGGGYDNPSTNTDDGYVDNGNDTDDNVTENPQTGQIAIFVVWSIALVAICYSVWYFKRIKEN